ncbi:oxidoreductase [Chitinophaga arvensicola]|uniref:NADP-dependent 3-hydroxy acid dehydrogenase YdfG n=1 Tax=Chitinophaga arvensicola TaxID=29529 RepID=A0A1I0S645_9BACT|nr:oxidoreductase [Chitinophaga arvensicola]SEW50655.1 NADP-dependent 3-hydroxy acid dehydrogenase YdfG [Chitinophaga arvensicola]
MWTATNNMTDQTGKTVIVTGANAGIGFETALALYKAGAHVVLACRNQDNAAHTAVRITESEGKGTLETALLDLGSLAAVEAFAETFKKQHSELHVLINNAGVMIPPASRTADGYELQFGVNFIGHFALTGHLYPLLKATAGARIVTLSSMAYLRGSIDFDNLKSEQSYDAMREYSQSKLANLLFSIELQRRIVAVGDDVRSIAAQPGANKTALSRHMNPDEFNAAVARIGELMEPWQGALPSLYAAVSDEVTAGALYGPDQDGGYRGYPAQAEIAPNALDEVVARRLWDVAETATGIHFPA